MRRRSLLSLLIGGGLVVPFAATAQRNALPVVGYLGTGGSPALRENIAAAFRDGLAKSGYVEGRNVMIEFRWAGERYDRFPARAADLVHRSVAVIAAGNLPAAVAAKNATATIPIVFRSATIRSGTDSSAASIIPAATPPGSACSPPASPPSASGSCANSPRRRR